VHRTAGRAIAVDVAAAPPSTVEAVVVEEDTYMVLSAGPEVREPAVPRLRAFHEAYTVEPAEPGSMVVRGGSPLRFLAVVHDLSRDPSWREEWVAAALEEVLHAAEARGLREVAMPALGRVHGTLPTERFLGLLRSALESARPRRIERLCLVVPDEEVAVFRKLLESRVRR